MSLVINWKPVNNAASYNIYRSNKKFTNAQLPTDKINIAGNLTSHEYIDVVRSTTYWFSISSVDVDGVETLGQIFPLGYFPENGPGPTTLQRGDWSFGLFGEVSVLNLLTSQQLKNALASFGANGTVFTGSISKYWKCVVNGKIIYIPDNYVMTVILGGVTTDATTYLRNIGYVKDLSQAPVLSTQGWDFVYRMPHASMIESKYMTGFDVDVSSEDYLGSEASLFAGLFSNTASNPNWPGLPAGGGNTKYRLGDQSGFVNYVPVAAGDKTAANSGNWTVMQTNGSLTVSSGVALRAWPVLELLL